VEFGGSPIALEPRHQVERVKVNWAYNEKMFQVQKLKTSIK